MFDHAIVRLSAKEAGLCSKSFNHYAILGDDVVIYNDLVAAKYLEFMTKLGVDVSLAKSFISSEMAEFAKSLFVKGTNYSPLPLELIKLRREHYYEDCTILLKELLFRGIRLDMREYIRVCDPEGHFADPYVLCSLLTYPGNPCYYPVPPVWGVWDQYSKGYIEFLRASRRIRAFDCARIQGVLHRLEEAAHMPYGPLVGGE